MNSHKSKTGNHQQHPPLVWIDCEMTGLDPEHDTILEIACIVTDSGLGILEAGPDIAIGHPQAVLDNMNDWCKDHHGKSGLTANVLASTVTMAQAESMVLELVQRHCSQARKAMLAGNSVHADKTFLAKYMPRLCEYLHYRIVDVSSVKELARRWNPKAFELCPPKKEAHR